MNHGQSNIDFSQLSPATIIVGREDGSEKVSNGTGKTNIFNAIKYALFNSKIGAQKERVIRNDTNKCIVSFSFELSNGNKYEIERFRTKNTQGVKLKIFEDNNWKDISGRTSTHTDELIHDIIKINEQTFENSSYLKQNDFKRRKIDTLASATPEERKNIIIDILQLGIWGKFEKRAKELRDDVFAELNITKSQIDHIGNPQTNIESFNNDINAAIKLIANFEKIIDESSKVLLEKQNEYSKNVAYLNSKNTKDIGLKLGSEKAKYNELERKINDAKKQKSVLENQIAQADSILQTQRNQHDYSIKELESIPQLEAIDESKYNNLLNIISTLKINIRDNKAALAIIKKPIPDDEFCNECGTELNDEYRETLLQKRLEKQKDIEKIIDDNEKELSKILLDKAEIEKQILNYNKTIEKKTKLTQLISKLENDISNSNETIQHKNKLLISHANEIVENNNILLEKKSIITELEKEFLSSTNKELESIVKTLESEIKAIEKTIAANRDKLSSAIYSKGQCQALLDIEKEKLKLLDELTARKKDLDKKYILYRSVMTCFGSSGIPAMIIHNMLGSLQNETNQILDELKPGFQIKFIANKENDKGVKSDTLDILYYKNGKEKDFLELSGGEQANVVLALKFATAEIARKRCGADIRMLLLDEVDQALDEQSVEFFYEIVRKLSKDMTILIITHNKELKARFKSFILTSKENDVVSAEVKNG